MPILPHTTRQRREARSFNLAVSQRGQLALLHLPALRNELVRRERLFLVEVFEALKGQISQNRFAELIGVPCSALSQWRKQLEAGGDLRNRRFGRKPRSRLTAPCILTFTTKR